MDHVEKLHQKESYIYASKMSNCTLKYLFKGTGTHFANVNEPMQMLGVRKKKLASFENSSLQTKFCP